MRQAGVRVRGNQVLCLGCVSFEMPFCHRCQEGRKLDICIWKSGERSE